MYALTYLVSKVSSINNGYVKHYKSISELLRLYGYQKSVLY